MIFSTVSLALIHLIPIALCALYSNSPVGQAKRLTLFIAISRLCSSWEQQWVSDSLVDGTSFPHHRWYTSGQQTHCAHTEISEFITSYLWWKKSTGVTLQLNFVLLYATKSFRIYFHYVHIFPFTAESRTDAFFHCSHLSSSSESYLSHIKALALINIA